MSPRDTVTSPIPAFPRERGRRPAVHYTARPVPSAVEDPAMTANPSAHKVLITGASSGIGEALAHEYARRGRGLVLLARRADRLQKLADELGKQVPCEI